MNRRRFVSLVVLTGAVGLVTAARVNAESSPKPVARLLNNEKGTWYNGKGTTDADVCRGDDAIIYEPEDLGSEALRNWWADTDDLVQQGYAEYL